MRSSINSKTGFLLPKLQSKMGKNKTHSLYSRQHTHQSLSTINNELLKRVQTKNETGNFQSRTKSTLLKEHEKNIKIKYIAKSPQYFKKKERSFHAASNLDIYDVHVAHHTVEDLVDEKRKQFDRNSVIEKTKQGIRKKYEYKEMMKKRETLHQQYKPKNKQIPSEMQTKYSNFNPKRIVPIVHALQKIHPSSFSLKP